MSAATPAQPRRTRQPLETPTPAPSSGHTSTLFTSIKPTSRSHSFTSNNNHQDYKSSYSLTSTQPRQPLAQQARLVNTIPECSTQELDLDHLEIPLDNTERDRRRLEHEFMDLAGALPSDGGYSSESIAYGGLSDAEQPQSGPAAPTMRDLRARIQDESESEEEEHRSSSARSRSSSSEQSFGDDFSLRVGMTGSRVHPMAPIEEVDHHAQLPADWTNDLSYVVSRTASPTSPPPPRQTAVAPTSAPAPTASSPAAPPLRGLGKEFERAQAQGAQRQVFGEANGRPSPAQQQQQRAAPQPQHQHQAQRPSHAPRLVPYPRTSPSLAHGAKLASPPQPQPQQRVRAPTPVARAPQPQPQSQSQPQSNKEYATSAASALPNVHYFGEEPSRRLPDITGLTDGLQTPGVRRGGGGGGGDEASESGVDDFTTLRTRLAALERQNTLSRERVRELESRLQEERAREVWQTERGSEEWEQRLREEMQRREDLESQVHRLHSQIAHLTRSLESHSATLSALRSQPSAQPQPIPDLALYNEVDALRHGLDALGQEMEVVKGAVDELLSEKLRGEQWEREEEERRGEMDSGGSGSAESVREREPRVQGLARRELDGERGRRSPAPAPETGRAKAKARDFVEQQQKEQRYEEEDPERTPRAREKSWKDHQQQQQQQWAGPETPKMGRSFIDGAEIQRLQAELAREEARRSPSPRPRRHQQQRDVNPPRRSSHHHYHHQQQHEHSAPTRPSTAPLPSHHRQQYAPPPPRSHASYDDSYASSAPAQQRRQPRREAATETEREELAQDFRRAEEIFRSVEAPRKAAGVPGSPGLCSVCRRRKRDGDGLPSSAPPKLGGRWEERGHEGDDEEERYEEEMRRRGGERKMKEKEKARAEKAKATTPKVDPQQALESVLRDLEDDFELHKRIYIELSDQYRSMDAKLGGGKRRALAEHLKESIDTLEIKADQVKRLHDLLHYHDPNAAPIDSGRPSFGAGRQRECVL